MVHKRGRAAEAPMRQSHQDKLQLSEVKNQILERNLSEKQDSLIAAEAERVRELRDKETENGRIIRDLPEQLNEARGQLYGGQAGFACIPEPQNAENLDLDYHVLVRRLTELAWFRDQHPDSLTKAVIMVGNKSYQKALIHLDTSMSATNFTPFEANAMLLKSNALRVSENPMRGLEVAEQVVCIANENDWPAIVGKAQFYRGLCFFDLGLYADAIRCYVRAASIRWYAREIARMIMIAEEKKGALPVGSPGKQLSEGFLEIPLSPTMRGLDTSPMQS